jgi:hypothetical protein
MGNFLKRFGLAFVLIAVSSVVYAQDHLRLRPPTAEEGRIAERNHSCVHRNTYTAEQRLSFYPFNRAKQVRLVSFLDSTANENALPLKNDTVDYRRLIEIKTLDKAQIDKLTDIMYNIGERAPNMIADPGAACYNPHNAILFADKTGHTFAYVEVCFECQRYRASSGKLKMGDFCAEKYNLLKEYFASLKVKIGITEDTH